MSMMNVQLVAEDGTETTISVPCERRAIPSRQISRSPRSTTINVPLPHPDFEFTAVIGGYRAERRSPG